MSNATAASIVSFCCEATTGRVGHGSTHGYQGANPYPDPSFPYPKLTGICVFLFKYTTTPERFKPPNHQKLDPAKPAGLRVGYAETARVEKSQPIPIPANTRLPNPRVDPVPVSILSYQTHTGTHPPTENTDFCVITEYIRGEFAPRVAPLAKWTHLDRTQCIESGTMKHKEVRVMRFVEDPGTMDEGFWFLRCDGVATVEGLLRIIKQISLGVDVVGQLEDSYPELFQQVQELAGMNVAETYRYR
ncbi:hypothetical protein DFH08DRAFT_811374 [Mycena albidolilacea]|uniref:Uncharacterized protein n=1 Tax=Mycena albidolilacea TaxID=1033008 RepID=A0AAD6ZWR6_9AGAR|nr:hypothetical protein DFH08DRAFT_811374 [Mycena albidolilacea]